MYRVQIVDDEPIIRMGLQRMYDWSKQDFEIACMAQNGKEALEQLEVEDIDLIITDVEMPIMNGLDFIREVRERKIDVEIIVLTAYEDFEYAKEAIKYGVSEYILKPIGTEDIEKMLIKAKMQLGNKTKN